MNEAVTKKRSTGIDLIKLIAIFSVVMIHVSAPYVTGRCDIGTWQFNASAVWRCLCTAGVPLFLMCSGALMLRPEKELPLKRLFFHNILRLVIAMLVWSFAYKLWGLYFSEQLNLEGIVRSLKEILVFDQRFHFYYIHIMLLVYFLLPVTRSFVKNASEKEMIYFLLAWFALGILYPTIRPYWPFSLISGFPLQWAMNMSYASVGYGVLGYWLSRKRFSAKLGAPITAVGFAAVLLPTILKTPANGELFLNALGGMSVETCVFATGLFILGLCAGERIRRGRGFVEFISRASFCIYLVHIFVIDELNNLNAFDLITPVLSIPLLTLVIVAVSCAVYWVISHIPVLNKWIV